MKKILIPLCLLIVSLNAAAFSGNKLLSACDDYSIAKGTFEQGFCLGMVTGVAYVSSKICVPTGVTNKQHVLIVEKWFKDNPQELHIDAYYLTEKALSKAWPC